MTTQKNTSAADKAKQVSVKPSAPVFGKMNYILIAISLLVVTLGFIMMAGKTDIYSTLKVSVAPVVVILGFCIGIVAIFYRKPGEAE